MKKLILTLVLCLCMCQSYAKKPNIVCTTAILGCIAEEIGKDSLEVNILIPYAVCPGHFDVKPSDIGKIEKADILFRHGWEKWFDKIILKKTKNAVKTLDVDGNLMIPDLHLLASKEICDVLCEIHPVSSENYKENIKKYIDKVKNASGKIKKDFKKYSGIKVCCSSMQADFLKWLGFDAALIYDREEEMSANEFSRIIKACKKEKIRFIIDNLQSGKDTGKVMADETGLKRVVLTNFPEKSYIESLNENAGKLLALLKEN